MDILQLQHIPDRLELQFPHLPLTDDFKKLKEYALNVEDYSQLYDELITKNSELETDYDDLASDLEQTESKCARYKQALRDIEDFNCFDDPKKTLDYVQDIAINALDV